MSPLVRVVIRDILITAAMFAAAALLASVMPDGSAHGRACAVRSLPATCGDVR